MEKFKRIAAGLGVLLLFGMYLCTLIFAILDSPQAVFFFRASLAMTFVVPVLCYGIVLFTRLSGRHDSNDEYNAGHKDNASHKNNSSAGR